MLYTFAAQQIYQKPLKIRAEEMQVRLPLFAQVVMAGGDRYLAANIAGFRSLLASTELMQSENYQVLAQVQQDVSLLNPAHEDNYYIAAAILPWVGEVDATQTILRRAIDARPTDWMPIFYYAFHLFHFKRDQSNAARWLQYAATKAVDENDRFALLNLSARWYEKGYNPKVAVGVLESMAASSKPGGFKKYLLIRANRLRIVDSLRHAAEIYQNRYGKPIRALTDLAQAGLIKDIPTDPFGFGYSVDTTGQPIVLNGIERKMQ